MTRTRGVLLAAGLAVVAVAAIVAVALALPSSKSTPTPAPSPAAGSSTATTTGGGGGGGGALVITAFHVITEVTCSGSSAAVPAAWSTRDARTVSFEVDGQPLPAAAGYPVSGTGNVPVPCDGRAHLVTLVAANGSATVQRSQHVNTENTPPPPNGPTVSTFLILADVTCPGGQPVAVAASWRTQNATTVSFSVDGQPLPAATGYPTSGAGTIPVPCDGRGHQVTITAANAANMQAALARSVNTEPYAPVPPVTPPPLTTTPVTPPPLTSTPVTPPPSTPAG